MISKNDHSSLRLAYVVSKCINFTVVRANLNSSVNNKASDRSGDCVNKQFNGAEYVSDSQKSKPTKRRCYFCRIKGHEIKDCRKYQAEKLFKKKKYQMIYNIINNNNKIKQQVRKIALDTIKQEKIKYKREMSEDLIEIGSFGNRSGFYKELNSTIRKQINRQFNKLISGNKIMRKGKRASFNCLWGLVEGTNNKTRLGKIIINEQIIEEPTVVPKKRTKISKGREEHHKKIRARRIKREEERRDKEREAELEKIRTEMKKKEYERQQFIQQMEEEKRKKKEENDKYKLEYNVIETKALLDRNLELMQCLDRYKNIIENKNEENIENKNEENSNATTNIDSSQYQEDDSFERKFEESKAKYAMLKNRRIGQAVTSKKNKGKKKQLYQCGELKQLKTNKVEEASNDELLAWINGESSLTTSANGKGKVKPSTVKCNGQTK